MKKDKLYPDIQFLKQVMENLPILEEALEGNDIFNTAIAYRIFLQMTKKWEKDYEKLLPELDLYILTAQGIRNFRAVQK